MRLKREYRATKVECISTKMRKSSILPILLLGYLAYGLNETSSPFDYYNPRRLFKRQTGNNKCTLPPYPSNGEWKVLNSEAKPGEEILSDSVVRFKCKSGYKLSTDSPYLVCDESWNSLVIPECEELCPPLYSSDIYQLSCRNKKGKEIKCSEATHGSYLEYTCAQFYETPFGYRKTLLCENGNWNNLKPVCQPICGKKIKNDGKPFIYGTKPNEKLEYPWMVALYSKINGSYINVCGGSMLSRTVVLTAAHCVTNDYGDTLSADLYMVGAGKLYNQYQDPRDTRAQYLQVSKIIVHEQYKGDSKRFLADIALLVIKEEFTLNEVMQPVCFNNLKSIRLYAGKIGEVSGWGRAEGGNVSDALRTLNIPYKYETTCTAELPSSWADKYNMIDKICAGFVNESTSVCDGDSGSGLTFENPEDNRYYVHGVVSLGLQTETQCNIQQNTLYTKVAFYYDFVDTLLAKYAPDVKDCALPPHPRNGKWTIDEQKKPGDVVSSSTVLNIQCDEGFKLSSPTSTILCDSAYNMPTCQAFCSKLTFPNGTDFRCINKEGQSINCSEAFDGSQLFYTCPRRYVIPENSNNARFCSNGSWGSPQPECVPVVKNCGKRASDFDASNKNENYQKLLDNPWLAIIYRKENGVNDYRFICSGSVLTKYIVLTAAHCLTDEYSIPKPIEDYSVTVGKLQSAYNESNNAHAQYRRLSHIIPHPGYRGIKRNYLADIAVAVVDVPFNFNTLVQPICFHGINTIHLQPGDIGAVFGWQVKDGDATNELETFNIPLKDETTCERDLPEGWADRFYIFDKICAGYDNKSSICRGDTGKAFAVKNPEDDRVYIHGLVSIGSGTQESCAINSLSTNVSFYYEFIEKELFKYNNLNATEL